MAAVENDDINVLLDHLSMARELVGDYRQKLIDAEPEKYGIYRDAVGRLWIHEFTNHQWELIEAREGCCHLDLWDWESLVMKKGNAPMFPMKFITPFIEKKEEN